VTVDTIVPLLTEVRDVDEFSVLARLLMLCMVVHYALTETHWAANSGHTPMNHSFSTAGFLANMTCFGTPRNAEIQPTSYIEQ
jgi:hypothetical protein